MEKLKLKNMCYKVYQQCSLKNLVPVYLSDLIFLVASSSPTGLSATIVSSSGLLISWTPLSNVNGYLIHYIPNKPLYLICGQNVSSSTLRNLLQGATYQIHVYSFKDLPSTSSSNISVFLDGKFDVPFIDLSIFLHPWVHFHTKYLTFCRNIATV